MPKSYIDRFQLYLQTVAAWSFLLLTAAIFIVAGAITLTLVWLYIEFY